MYKQILLNENQQHLQILLWRDDENEPIKAYKLTTVTFGIANSPFIAIRTVKHLGQSIHWHGKRYEIVFKSTITMVVVQQ